MAEPPQKLFETPFFGMRTRGITGAGKFMSGAAAAYNLKKWLNFNLKKLKTGAMMKLREELNQLQTDLTQQTMLRYKALLFSIAKF